MAFSFDVASNIPRLNQSGTDTNLSGIATAINAVVSVARSTAYTTAMLRKPPTPTGFWYRCSTAGTTAATAPTYGTTDGGTTTDGTSVWTAFKAPDIQTLGTTNHYYMPAFRFQIQGTLTNSNPQQENFTCSDVIIFAGNFTSGSWATDGVTPRWDGLHFAAVKVGANNADPTCLSLQSGAQFTFIGGEVQVASAIGFDSGTTPRSYQTRWRNTKEWGASSSRIRSYTTNAIFTDCEFFDVAYDLFRMPTVAPSIKARGSEYLFQYVGSGAGGADAKFSASALENVDGTYDFDNYFGGWVELYNCKAGESLKVYSQHPSSSIWSRHCVPLYQDIRITAKDTTGAVVQNVRFNSTDSPANSPTVTFTTVSSLKTWDFRSPLSYQTTTDSSGIALSTPVLNVWYWEVAFRKNLRFPNLTATYQGRAYNYKTTNVSVVLGSNSIQDVSAGMISLDTATTVTESVASAITGISLVADGRTGGNITISSNKTYQDIWNYYRWWISQFANNFSNDVWTCTGGVLNIANWNVVVNAGVNLTDSANITKIQSSGSIAIVDAATMPKLFNAGGVLQPTGILLPSTVLGVLDTYTGTGSITAIYQDNTGTSTNLKISGFDSGSAVYVEDNNFVKKFYSANASGEVIVYIPPTATGSWYYAVEKYGNQRQSDFFTFSGGQKAIVVKAIPDTGLTVLNSATVGAYTSLENPDKIYDYVAFLRLSEPHISYGQIVFKDGKSLDLQNASMLVNQSASAVASFNYDTKLLTIKSLVLNTGVKFDKIIAIPPATITANTNEQINVLIEDANGDSSLTLLGGDNLGYKLWKVPSSSPVDVDPTTGVLLTTLANNTSAFRFIGISGFDIIGIDLSSGVKRRTSMLKGVYTQSFYVGDQIQLSTDAPQLIENNQKLDELILKVDTNLDVAVSTRATDEQVWDYTTRTLTSAGAAGATLAEIEASTILAKEATSQSIKTKVDSLNNYNDVALVAKVDAIKTVADSIKTTVEDKTGYSLTESQINLIAYTVESHLLNEGDSQQLVNAIVGAIGNTNIDETVLVAAIRADLERAGGKIDSTAVKVDGLANYDDTTLQAKVDAVKTKVDKSLTKTQFLSFD